MKPIRRTTHQVQIDHITVGSDHPVVIQSMTNTDTADAAATAQQVKELADAGSEMVRITVNSPEAASQVAEIRQRLDDMGCAVPLIGDFHFNGERLLAEFPDCARALSKYRINPGNVGKGAKGDEKFAYLIRTAAEHNKAVRIGVNWGSLDQSLAKKMMDENLATAAPKTPEEVMKEALIVSALQSAQKAVDLGLPENKIILSCKVSNVQDLITVYRDLAARCRYPLHLGLTEAGMGSKGIVASTAALSVLLQEGIGDTIRISLTPEPNSSRTQEVIVAQEILQTMGLRSFTPMVTACPGCATAHQQNRIHQLPRLRAHHQHGVSRIGAGYSAIFARADERVALAISGGGEFERGGDGLRGQWARREQAGGYWHFAAGHGGNACCACVCGWRAQGYA